MTNTKGVYELTDRELEKIINKYSRLLWSVSSKILNGIGSEQDVEECVADVFIDLWQEPQKFDESRGSLKNWLCIKARSKSIDRFRRLSSRITEEMDENQIADILEPGEDLLMRERVREAKDALLALGEPEREIMIRRFYMDQRPAYISKVMDLPVRKVENIIYRTKEKLKEKLGDRV